MPREMRRKGAYKERLWALVGGPDWAATDLSETSEGTSGLLSASPHYPKPPNPRRTRQGTIAWRGK